MSSQIHPTAIIYDGAKIADNVAVGPYCVIGADVTLSDGVELVSHVNIDGLTNIGKNTKIHPFASIGTAPQDLKFAGEKSQLIIGENNTIREHVTMNTGTAHGAMKTVVGDNCLFMMASHVAHDCVIGNNVIMANNATLAGHVEVGDNVIIGGLSAVHQFIRIGNHAIIGGMSAVDNDVIPYARIKGERAFLAGLNLIGLERSGFDKSDIKQIQRAFKQIFNGDGTLDQRVENASNDFSNNDLVMSIINFIKDKDKFPICQPSKK